MTAGKQRFAKVLLDVARRIPRPTKTGALDVRTVWQAFLYLVHTGDGEAEKTLKEAFKDRTWEGRFPSELLDKPASDIPETNELKRLFTGPLSLLNKKYKGRLTPSTFIEILARSSLAGELGLAPRPAQASRGDSAASSGTRKAQKAPAPAEKLKRGGTTTGGTAGAAAPDNGPGCIEELQRRLEGSIFGQTSALRAFVDGLRTSLDRPVRPGKLGGSFLVFGPPGSGKSELVRILEEWVRDRKQQLRLKTVIYCEGYLSNALPALRQRIRSSPPAFIVLSDFEKYDPAFRDILMEGLDRAVLQLPDRFVGGKLESTDIQGWVVILIGNVGRAFWGRLPFKEKEILPDPERIKEFLEQEAVADPHRKSDVFQTHLNRPFLDRIGCFVPFCQLRYADVSRILDREIDALSAEVRERDCDLIVDPAVRDLAVLSSYYKRGMSGRQALRGFREHIESPVRAALSSPRRPSRVALQCTDKTFNRTLRAAPPCILIVDDEHERACQPFIAGLTDSIEIVGAPDIDVALTEAASRNVDLMLLDLYFDGRLLWKDYLERWRAIQPEIPVVLLSNKLVTSADRFEIDRVGGVLGFVEKRADPGEAAASLAPFLRHAAWQARIRAFEERYGYGGDRVLFDTRVDASGDCVTVRFSDVRSVVGEGKAPEAEGPVLPPETRREINEFLGMFLDVRKRAELNIAPPRGLLLHGPPGNGKTMLARSIAQQMRCNFLAVSASDFQSRWAGVAAERLRDLFEQARMRQPCVVFIDEIDAVAPRRVEDVGGGLARDQASTVATLLTELDGFAGGSNVFVIGATNRKEAIDEAVLRPGRLDRMIEVSKPGIEERRELLERALDRPPHEIDVVWAARETFGLSCAEIVRAVHDSVIVALRNGQDSPGGTVTVTPASFREAVDRLRYGQAPRQGSMEQRVLHDARELVAWHEAGHLVLTLSLIQEVPDRATIVPRGDFGGFVRQSEESVVRRRGFRRRGACIRELATLLAGGLAEEKRFGEHSSGVSGDRRTALELARTMVAAWGMSSLEAEVHAFLAGDPGTGVERDAAPGQASTSGIRSVTHAIVEIMREATELAETELERLAEELQHAAELLLEHEELDRDDIEREFSSLIEGADSAKPAKRKGRENARAS